MKKLLALLGICLFFSGCVLNMSMAHTEGEADDVNDETTSNTPAVSTNVNVPLPKVPSKLDLK